jgi:hypothetical protein
MRKRWQSILIELVIWGGIAIITAVVLVLLSEELLPANF